MFVLENYVKRMNIQGSSIGRSLKKQSDQIMNASFARDIDYQVAKLYDQNQEFLEEVEVKFKKKANYSISGDAVDFLVQFRPLYHPEKKFHLYDKDLDTNGNIVTERLGYYIDLKDDSDKVNTWLIVGKSEDNQFTTYNVLKCNYTCRWIKDGKIHEKLAVLRFANSYNSGEWNDGFTTMVQNQAGIWMPTTKESETLDYNDRLIIADRTTNPPTFHVSKVEDMYPVGVTKFTLAQNLFNPVKDNAELKIADYYASDVVPEKAVTTTVARSEITMNSKSHAVALGGSAKKMVATFYDNDNNVITAPCTWEFYGELNGVVYDQATLSGDIDVVVNGTELSVKFKKNATTLGYIGMVVTIVVNRGLADESSMQLEVTAR